MVYFDNAATSHLTPKVIERMTQVMSQVFGNPSSLHQDGRKANQLLRQCRQELAQALAVKDNQLIFTSGGTESNNLAIKGYALANQDKGKHLITTSVEHHSVLHTMSYLETCGFEVTYLEPINQTISAQQVKEALRPDTILVSIMYANNETGDVYPIEEIGTLLTEHQAVFHVDAIQVIGKLSVHPQELHIDLLSASAHKFHGPKGCGFLYHNTLKLTPLLHGGQQENNRRASTENLIGIAGMTTALLDCLAKEQENLAQIYELKASFLKQLDQLGVNYYLNQGANSLPYVLSLGFPETNNALLLTQLDLAGFSLSAGSACTAGNIEPSHVLASYYGKTSPRLNEVIRISFSEYNTLAEVLALAQILKKVIKH
ncbi:cysteine desulfurase family protein [Streptococcus sp. sy010]|uniref:cysteine desulfurase family protein n=1 Tax=Streptococcus sp. sy010 TaxID=2600148 RepID=UPI0011B39EEE|nr:cysteine desulfurase family protein [Streptococcus sp. sy010]TWT16735.1 cysteine desulfurase [Streptococcus sp. sy010]